MQQGFQPASLLGVLKDQAAQCGAIQLPVGLQDTFAKMLGYLGQRRAARFHHPARGMVGVNQVHALLDEKLRNCALATTNAAGKAENPGFHDRMRCS
ncbi:hypothetical protein D9M68_827220 [compost metagenome]